MSRVQLFLRCCVDTGLPARLEHFPIFLSRHPALPPSSLSSWRWWLDNCKSFLRAVYPPPQKKKRFLSLKFSQDTVDEQKSWLTSSYQKHPSFHSGFIHPKWCKISQNPKWFDVIFETSRPQQKRCRTPQNPKTTASLIKICSNPTASFGKNPPTNRRNLFPTENPSFVGCWAWRVSHSPFWIDLFHPAIGWMNWWMDGTPFQRTTQLPYLGVRISGQPAAQQGCVFFLTFLQQGIPESPTKSSFATVSGQNAMADPMTQHRALIRKGQ